MSNARVDRPHEERPPTVAHRLGGMRLAWVAAWLAMGIVLGLAGGVGLSAAAWTVAAMVVAGAGVFLRGAAWTGAAALAVMCFGAAWAGVRAPSELDPLWTALANEDKPLIEVQGLVAEPGRVVSTQRGALAEFALVEQRVVRSELIVERVRTRGGWRDADGRVWLRTDDPRAVLRVGQRLSVTGHFQGLRGPMNAGEGDVRAIAHQRGIVGSVRSPGGTLVREHAAAGGWWGVKRWWSGVRQRGMEALRIAESDDGPPDERHAGSAPGRRLLAALTLGERTPDGHETFEAFTTMGIAHLLAVSGLHLGLLVGMVLLAVRLTGDRPGLEVWAVLAVVVLYVLLVPARPPIMRAAVMSVALTAALVGRRRYPPMNALGLAAIVVMLVWPADVMNAGFQLSFLVVGSLILGVPAAREMVQRWRDPLGLSPTMPMAVRWSVDALSTAAIAWLASLPIVWAHFGVASWLSVPATIVATPVVALLLGWGFVAVLVGLVWPSGGAWLGDPAAWVATRVESAGRALAEWPGAATHAPMLPTWIAVMSTALIFAAMMLMPRGTAVFVPRRSWAGSAVAFAIAWTLLVFGGWGAGRLPSDVVLRWDAMAVGDGSCHIIRTRETALFFDCGSMWFGVGEQSIPRAAKASGALPIHTAIVTHADVDHFSGLLDASRATGVRRVLVPESLLRQAEARPDDAAAALLAGLGDGGIEVRAVAAGDAIELGVGVRGVFLHPPDGFVPARDNEGSLVLLLEVETLAGTRRLLMTGDLEGPTIELVRRALAERGWPEIGAMEAPHHGAAHPGAIALVREIDPTVVVQSTGPRRVDDPRWESGRAGRVWLTTARDGAATITIHTDGSVRARSWGER